MVLVVDLHVWVTEPFIEAQREEHLLLCLLQLVHRFQGWVRLLEAAVLWRIRGVAVHLGLAFDDRTKVDSAC